MTFKEALRDDAGTIFMNTDEFAALHTVNGKSVPVLIDNNELIERSKKMKSDMDGVNVKTTLIYVKARDFGALPPMGYAVRLDNKAYLVREAINEDGVYSILLEANRN